MKQTEKDHETMMLSHDPVPGYKPVFYTILAVSVIYLAVILFKSL